MLIETAFEPWRERQASRYGQIDRLPLRHRQFVEAAHQRARRGPHHATLAIAEHDPRHVGEFAIDVRMPRALRPNGGEGVHRLLALTDHYYVGAMLEELLRVVGHFGPAEDHAGARKCGVTADEPHEAQHVALGHQVRVDADHVGSRPEEMAFERGPRRKRRVEDLRLHAPLL